MKRAILAVTTVAGLFNPQTATAQGGAAGSDYKWFRWSEVGMVAGKPTTVAGAVHRKAIPNEYLEIVASRGNVHVRGAKSDSVTWQLLELEHTSVGKADSTGRRPAPVASKPSYAKTLTSADRLTLELQIDPATVPYLIGETKIQVPHDLKVLHVTVHGGGNVVVENYDGDLTVTTDSGSIAGTDLDGPVAFEANNGGVSLDLSNLANPRGPVSVLSRNGSVSLLLSENPSVVLNLIANCGNFGFDFPVTDGKVMPGQGSNLGGGGPELDCRLRPKSLPPLPGVLHLRNNGSMMFGDGALRLTAMALQGDINVSKAMASVAVTPSVTGCRLMAIRADSIEAKAGATGMDHMRFLGNVRLRCANMPISIQADSVLAESSHSTSLWGHVCYRDSGITVTADAMRFFADSIRLDATGNVRMTDRSTGKTVMAAKSISLHRRDVAPGKAVASEPSCP